MHEWHACMQAGARKVYAIEASRMVGMMQKLFDANGEVGARVQVLHGKVETLLDTLPERADVLISEPMGTLLVNERMLETYVLARRHFLAPGGLMFPSLGRIFVAAFSDAALHAELQGMAAFWLNPSFYGVNLTCLHADAMEVLSRHTHACPACAAAPGPPACTPTPRRRAPARAQRMPCMHDSSSRAGLLRQGGD
jgi:hypothetical protein